MGFDPRNFPQPGQLVASAVVDRMKLTDEQKKQLADLQKEADGKLDDLLKDDQKKQFKQMQDFAKTFARGPGGPPGGPGGGPGGPPGGFGGFGPPGGSGLFRAPRYAADYPGLQGKDLTPGKTIEELEAQITPKDKDPKDR
jgi:hypothetical protein